MKKILLAVIATICMAGSLSAQNQKYAYVDTEYILSNIPTYEAAQKKLDDLSKGWEEEVKTAFDEVEQMYRKYQSEKVLMSDDMRMKKENEIIGVEKKAKDLKNKYFGPDGEIIKKRKEMIKPIQDEVYNAIKEVAREGNFTIVYYISANPTILYTDPRFDKSDDVLEKLGYKSN